jgi:hypothetical protein
LRLSFTNENAAGGVYGLFTVAAACDAPIVLMRLLGSGSRRNAHAAGIKLTELRTDVDIKIALFAALIGVIAFFSHRQWPEPTSQDRETA